MKNMDVQNDDYIKLPTFTRGDFESSLEAWNTFWTTHKDNITKNGEIYGQKISYSFSSTQQTC